MLDSMFIDSFADSYINVDLGLYGGFFGWELRRCERDPEANETVLHGGEKALRGVTVCAGLTSATISGNTFTDNLITSFGAGGAIACLWSDGQVLIDRNVFEGNGGAFCNHGGGITLHDCHSAAVTNSLFVGNHARGSGANGGAGVHSLCTPYASGGPPLLIRNNTFVGNFLLSDDEPPVPTSYGGAIHVRERPATVVNNVFNANLAAYGLDAASTGGASVAVSHCDAYPGDGSSNYYHDVQSTLVWDAPGYDNLFVDPEFCGAGLQQYWLAQGSGLRGARDLGVVPGGDIDLDGRPRPGGNGVDMGCYEDNPQCE